VLLFLGLSGLFDSFFGRFNYLAPFTVLLLCGLGAPFPEEVALIGSGLLLHQGEVDFLAISLVCSCAILIGDSLPFWLGRRYGLSALRKRWVRRLLHPERIALLERRFHEHGNWLVFTCRFLPGIRIPGYFFAGTMRMSYPRFLVLDVLGVLISVPTSIYLGKLFGQSVEHLKKRFDQLHLVLAFLVVSIVLAVVVRARIRKREREAVLATHVHPEAQAPAGSSAGSSTGASAGPPAGAPGAPREPADAQTTAPTGGVRRS
jgi:membrane protein DedA with SNARE-associated domain